MNRINLHIGASGVFILVENFAKSLASIRGSKDSSLLVRPVRVTGHCDKDAIRIFRVDRGDLGNLLSVA